MHLPNLAFVFLALVQPTNLPQIGACVFVKQYGYGSGFTAYVLYLIFSARGPQRISRYDIGTGFMALGVLLAKLICGKIQLFEDKGME